MRKGTFLAIMKGNNVREMYGYIAVYTTTAYSIVVGYDKRSRGWYATDIETGAGLLNVPRRTLRDAERIASDPDFLMTVAGLKQSNTERVAMFKKLLSDYNDEINQAREQAAYEKAYKEA